MPSKFAAKVKQFVKEAPVASGGTSVNFGPMTVTPMVITFKGRGQGNTPDKLSLGAFAKKHRVSVQDVELSENDQIQLHFEIDVRELNPQLNFVYTRDVAILNSSPDGKRKTDWSETVLPALEKVFGKNWEEAIISDDGEASDPIWVQAEDVTSHKPVKPGERAYGTIKLVAAYDSREECEAARDERFPPRDGGAATAEDVEDGDEDLEDEDLEDDGESYPEKLLNQVYAMYKSNKRNAKATKVLISKNKAWSQYDTDDLLQSAINANE